MDNKNKGYEPENLNTTPALIGGLVLGLLTVFTMVLCLWMFGALEEKAGERDDILSPLISERVLPPHPRLQTNPNSDIAVLRARESALLDRYQWVDKNSGTARIPISRAIDIVAKEGLPTEPPAEEPSVSDEAPAPIEEASEEAAQ